MKNLTQFVKDEDLNNFANLLLDNGYTLIHPNEQSSYFHFFKDGALGYVQTLGGCVSFTSEHKPCREAGTGYSVLRAAWRNELTLENAAKTCQRIICNEDRASGNVKFWASPEEFANSPFNAGRYTITTPNA